MHSLKHASTDSFFCRLILLLTHSSTDILLRLILLLVHWLILLDSNMPSLTLVFACRVRVKNSLQDIPLEDADKGLLEDGMVGLVTCVSHDGRVTVDYGFPSRHEITLPLEHFEPIFTNEAHWKGCPIQVLVLAHDSTCFS